MDFNIEEPVMAVAAMALGSYDNDVILEEAPSDVTDVEPPLMSAGEPRTYFPETWLWDIRGLGLVLGAELRSSKMSFVVHLVVAIFSLIIDPFLCFSVSKAIFFS